MTRRKTGLARRNPNDFGSVEKRGERYRALFRRDGRTIRAPRTFTTRDDARHWLSEQERALRGGTWIDPRLSEDSLAAYVAAWLSDHSADLSPRTVENYSRHLTKWVLPRLGKERLGEITPTKVRSWRAGCLKDAAAAAGAGQEQPSAVSIRAWAVATGLDVAPTGRLPQHIVLAWNAAGCPTLTRPC
ncbi:Lsr2 family DNA-binding protein [Microbacterium sp. bgisy207]|uniref:Lsr2 family DNA-binding protein n=1 Tax=Microbacterium sp. bgisy207 TaxID=3413800 RepID=UPI003EB7E47D